MGKKIDRAALHALAALGLYLGFVSAFGSIWLAAACALCALLLLRKLLSPLAGRLPKREARRGRARAEVERWALLDKDAAEAEARALLEKAYPGQAAEAELLFLPRHPQGPPLNLNAVLDAWRGRGGEKLLLITTARADAAAHACAAKLAHPAVRLIDGERLCALLAAFPPPKREEAPARRRLRIAVSRERAPRRLLFGLLLAFDVPALGQPPLSGGGAFDALSRRDGMEKAARSQAAVRVMRFTGLQGVSSSFPAPAGR